MKRFEIRRLAVCSIFCAVALTIFVIEAQIPLPIPLPGVKLGLSNIITLFALLWLSPSEAFLILVGRILLGAVFTGNPSSLLYSLSGGIICLFVENLLLKFLSKRFIIEISIIGAMIHNTVQILCAVFVTGSASVFAYMPPLIVIGAFCGLFCGLCIWFVDKKFEHIINRLIK